MAWSCFSEVLLQRQTFTQSDLVQVERLDVAIGLVPVLGKEGGQHQGVLDGHARPLPVVGRRGVAGVAQEGDVAAAPPGGNPGISQRHSRARENEQNGETTGNDQK